jgi:hypothetical protein
VHILSAFFRRLTLRLSRLGLERLNRDWRCLPAAEFTLGIAQQQQQRPQPGCSEMRGALFFTRRRLPWLEGLGWISHVLLDIMFNVKLNQRAE